MSKIMKLRLNLSEFVSPEYCRLFSGHGVFRIEIATLIFVQQPPRDCMCCRLPNAVDIIHVPGVPKNETAPLFTARQHSLLC